MIRMRRIEKSCMELDTPTGMGLTSRRGTDKLLYFEQVVDNIAHELCTTLFTL